MDFSNILISRVKNINVFNLVHKRGLSYHKHLSSIVDDDLIEEFLFQVNGIGEVGNSLGEAKEQSMLSLLEDLKNAGATFFKQFFPEEIQEYLRHAKESFLFLHLVPALGNIPYELLYDTDHFLCERFYIAKSASPYWSKVRSLFKKHFCILIIADPTEDLPWAREEGQKLFDTLNSEMNIDFIEVQILSGKKINKVELLHEIKKYDIIHYTGHTYIDSDPHESGWLLSNGKVLRAREIKKAGASPILVFSNSCASSKGIGHLPKEENGIQKKNSYLNYFADAFVRTGINHYIGTNWKLEDSQSACEFALHFYRSIFDAKSIGQALFEAREFARASFAENDLTWANYVLHGDPSIRITRQRKKSFSDALRSRTLLWRVRENYPLPIAQFYLKLVKGSEGKDARERFELITSLFQNSIFFLSAISLSNSLRLGLSPSALEGNEDMSLKELINCLYKNNKQLRSYKSELIPSRFINSLYLHQDEIKSMLKWLELFKKEKIPELEIEIYLSSFQYLMESLLDDLYSLSDCQLIYFRSVEDTLLLKGEKAKRLPDSSLAIHAILENESYAELKEGIFFFHPARNALLYLSPYLQYDDKTGKIGFSFSGKGEGN